MEKKEFKYGRESVYKLISVKDRQGNDRTEEKPFYKERVGCIATDFFYDDYPSSSGLYRLNMTFVRNKDGQWASRGLHTSVVFEINDKPNGFELVTAYSVYDFENAELNDISAGKETNLIELFLSHGDNDYFAKGFFYDSEGKVYELKKLVHAGMFQDSVLIRFADNKKSHDFACRYFPRFRGIEFYNTIYQQQDYSTPMLIHNTGERAFEVKFAHFPYIWIIEPGTSKRIIPYNAEGADEEDII